jgi:hypothetical protein
MPGVACLSAKQGPRVAPPWVFTGVGAPGPCGARNAFSSLLLSEVDLNGAGTCAGTLTASPRVKATANTANSVKRDDRVKPSHNQKVFA